MRLTVSRLNDQNPIKTTGTMRQWIGIQVINDIILQRKHNFGL